MERESEYNSSGLYRQIQILENTEQPLSREERLSAMNRPLLLWYEENARILPWRENPKPYRVWISEIMLQQTRVEAVKPYFERFMEALPDIESLAEVEEDRLLKLWEGLGYYNRARNLKKAAQLIVKEYGGRLPASFEELKKLPGIGSYTAGAVASIAFHIPVPAVDGNVLRVISRVLASREDILKQSVKKQMEQDLAAAMPADRAGDFNQSLIETGAVRCVPNGRPRCSECPLESICLSARLGLTGEIPYKSPKKQRRVEERTVLLLEWNDKIAIHKRSTNGLLASLYEFPNLEGHLLPEQAAGVCGVRPENILSAEPLVNSKHIFSHVEWHMTGYRVKIKEEPDQEWVMVEKYALKEKYPLPNAFHAYMKLVK